MKNIRLSLRLLPVAGVLATLLVPLGVTAAVSPYSWLRGGEFGILADSSGKNHPFNAAFSAGCAEGGGGLTAATTSSTAAGGPLGATGATSQISTLWGSFGCGNSGAWVQGPGNSVPGPELWSLPAKNWVMECWVLPVGTGGVVNRTTSQFMSTGSGHFGGKPGGAAFRTRVTTDENGNEAVELRADAIGVGDAENFTIGEPVVVDGTRWTHLAVVNNDGVTTFYVNGVASGEASSLVSAPSGVPYIGSGQDTGAAFSGYLDELRYSTFEPGQFAVADLLLLPAGPGFISQPQSASVWAGGAAPFETLTTLNPDNSFQWKRDDVVIAGATGPDYTIPSVTPADTGSVFKVTVSNNGVSTTTPDATLTVVPVATENTAFYRSAINAEASLLAYFPVDGNTGVSLTNTKDASRNASLEGGASYDGRTNRSYGERAVRLRGDGAAVLLATPAYEFADGTGTVEALVHLDNPAVPRPKTIFSVAAGVDSVYYTIQVAADGNSLIYKNDTLPLGVTWGVSPSLLNRLAHVAVVFSANKVTAYVDGIPLGAKDNPSFGVAPGAAAHIGSSGLNSEGLPLDPWTGSIDELAVYGDALSDLTLAVHNSRFIYGTAVTPPTLTASPVGVTNVLSGGAPIFRAAASGTAPLSYTWKRNGVPVVNNATATKASFTILNSTAASSGEYTVTVSNPIGEVTSAPFTVNFTDPAATEKYAALVLADGPTAYWRLNETTGETLTDFAGGLNGAYNLASVERGMAGPYGIDPDTATLFKQSGVAASVPYTPTLNPTGAFSVEFWAKPNVSGNASRAIVGTQNRNTGRAGYAIYQGFNGAWWEAHLGTGETVMFLSGSTAPVAGRWDHVVMTWNGQDFAGLYVNGRLEAQDITARPHRNNLSQPLEIGSRFNGTVPYSGTIDEVAFYNYALTPAQIEKHFSIAYFASSITSSPEPVLNGGETSTITLTAAVTGFPNTYQWFKDGVALSDEEVNADGSRKYPQGVSAPKLAISQGLPSDSGQYYLAVTNPLGNSATTPVAVNVALDTTPPTVAYVTGTSTLNRVRVAFNKPMTPGTLTPLVNYAFSGGLTVTGVTLTTDPSVINLTTTGMVPNTAYSLVITGAKDARVSQNTIGANSTAFTSFVLTPGLMAWDYYRGIPGTDVGSLQGDSQFPAGVWTSRLLPSFSSMPVTIGGNLNNNPEFGPLGDNYGARVYGYLTPTESGNYHFFLRSDDASELLISTDTNPANAGVIAFETACCEGFKEPGTGDETSQTVSLLAGQSYYIEALYKEGGGGDHVEVAWRKEGDQTPAGTLQPIPGSLLSTYAPAPPALGQLNAPTITGTQATVTWTGSGILQQSVDLVTWTDVPGQPASGYMVTVPEGSKTFYRLRN